MPNLSPTRVLFPLSCVLLAVASVANTSRASAPISSTFDTGLDGWTASGPGTPSYQSSGGNPGGYMDMLRFAVAPDTLAVAPSKFTGNLSSYDGATISFDAGLVSPQPDNPLAAFGTISIYHNSSPTPLTQDIAPGIPGTAWQTYSGPFSAAGFGVSQATWISDISSIDSMTFDFSTYDIVRAFSPVGIDNVIITPEPASFAILAAGGIALLRRRR